MTDLISRDALRESLGITGTVDSCKGCRYDTVSWAVCGAKSAPSFDYVCVAIDEAPAVDAVPVRHGKWYELATYEGCEVDLRCSNCGATVSGFVQNYKYCPYCGARMDAENERKEE